MSQIHLNLSGISSSYLKNILIKNTPAVQVFLEHNPKLKTDVAIFIMIDREKIQIQIPEYFQEYNKNKLTEDLFNYLIETLRENYPEYYI